MHRVELKDAYSQKLIVKVPDPMFLMHRVELKAEGFWVSWVFGGGFLMHRVELKEVFYEWYFVFWGKLFLMHRVELKEPRRVPFRGAQAVPNAPCGVESRD